MRSSKAFNQIVRTAQAIAEIHKITDFEENKVLVGQGGCTEQYLYLFLNGISSHESDRYPRCYPHPQRLENRTQAG